MRGEIGRDPQGGVLAEPEIDRALRVHGVVVAVRPDRIARGLAQMGLDGEDVDRARGGIATVKRALRPLQHLDPVDVIEGAEGRARPRDIDAVDVEGGGGIGARREGEVADAADEQQVALNAGGDHHRRGQLPQRLQPAYARVDQIRARHDRHRDRRLLQVLAAGLGVDDYVLEAPLLGGRLRRLGLAA